MEFVANITNKNTEVSLVSHENELRLLHPSVVQLSISRGDVKSVQKVGYDLIITLVNGQIMTIHDFFIDAGGTPNDLVLQEDDNSLWYVNFYDTSEGFSYEYTPIDSIEPLIIGDDDHGGLAAILIAGAGLSAVGLSDRGDHQGDHLGDNTQPAPHKPAAPTGTIVTNDNGTVTLSGTSEPGSTVHVTFPDGSTGSGQAGPDGKYEITITAPDGSGDATVTAEDAEHNVSPPAEIPYVDQTAPDAPDAPASYQDNVGSIQSDASTAPTTDDTTPGINVGKNLTDTPKLYVDGKEVPATYDPATGTLTPNDQLPDGEHEITYTLTDAAGNESDPSGAISITVDTSDVTSDVAATATISAITYDTGVSAGDSMTSDTTLLVDATVNKLLSADEKVQISLDGGKTWYDATQVSANTYQYDATGTPLEGGTHIFQARVVNAEGTPGDVTSQTVETQPIDNADNAVYYAGSGVDLIATGSGDNAWVHGIGSDTTGTTDTSVLHDTVSGGKGDNYIGIVSTNFSGVSGGNGWDTLVFEGSNIKLNLADMGLRVQSIEQFDLNNQSNTDVTDPLGQFTGLTHGNTLELRLSDVLSQLDAISPSSTQRMTILGDDTSTVGLLDSDWAATGDTQVVGDLSFDVWHNATMGDNTMADLLIQQGVHVI